MCDPVSIGLIAVSALQARAANESAEAEFTQIGAATAERQANLGLEQQDVQEDVATGVFLRARQGVVERSALRTAAGEAGVTGQSITAILGSSRFAEAFDIAQTRKGGRRKIRSLEAAKRGTNISARSAVAGVETVSTAEQVAGLVGPSIEIGRVLKSKRGKKTS